MEKIKVNYHYNNSFAQIILDDGKGNVLDSIMMAELHSLFNELKLNHDLKLITIEGAGKHFSFGASVQEHTKEQAPMMLKSFHQLFYDLIDLNVIVIAKVTGQCLGGGMELALMSNFIFSDKSAKFGQPEIVLGVFAPPASLLLPLKIGQANAEDLLLTGRIISADEALSLGLVNIIFDDKESIQTYINDWFENNIMPKSSISLKHAVRSSRTQLNDIITKKLPELEKRYVSDLMETSDANEGITAFLEKRKAVWSNL